jgi:hypothetical protein
MLSAPRMSACSAVNPQSRQTNSAWLVRLRLSTNTGVSDWRPACARAIEVGDPSYRTIKGILIAGTEHAGDEPASGAAAAAGAFLRGPDEFGTDIPVA